MDAMKDMALVTAFVAVGEAASFSAAAKKLGVTTATISRSIAKLERAVGARLVHRTTRQMSLSTAGKALFERSASHVRDVRAALRHIPERDREPAGTLRLTAPHGLTVTLLGGVIARYVARYPKVRVEVDVSNRNVDIVAEGFDLALRGDNGKRPDSSLIASALVTTPLRFYASPSYLARRGTPRVLGSADHDWSLFPAAAKQLKLPRGFQARIEGNDFQFLCEASCQGACISLLPTVIAEPKRVTGELVAVLPEVQPKGGRLLMLYPAALRATPNITAFRELLVAALPGWTGR